MEIIKKICEDNPVCYELDFALRLKNVQLAFTEKIPSALRDCVRAYWSIWVCLSAGVVLAWSGLPLRLLPVPRTFIPSPLLGKETIAWVIYLIAAWEYGTLAAAAGDHVFTMWFSAK